MSGCNLKLINITRENIIEYSIDGNTYEKLAIKINEDKFYLIDLDQKKFECNLILNNSNNHLSKAIQFFENIKDFKYFHTNNDHVNKELIKMANEMNIKLINMNKFYCDM